ncbi:MAG: glycosyltransferase family 4 protein [Clostridia bacterium]|nr:glycosyltransferase family 4 protein [Clostridia bacterium]
MYNVLNISHFSAASAGNFIRSFKALSRRVKSQGGNFIWVFPRAAAQREWTRELISSGEKVYFMSFSFFADAKLFRKLIRSYDINIVHTNFAEKSEYLPLRIACAFSKVRIVAHIHSNFKKTNSSIMEAVKRFLINSDVNICVSEELAAIAGSRGMKNNTVVTNAVDFSRLDTYDPIDRESLGVSSDKVILMSFGYDFRIKGIDVLLDALDTFDVQRRYIAMICAAGHVEEATATVCERYGKVPDHIKLMPARDDVGAYYSLADYFVAPSRSEGFSYARVEAAYCGTPQILSDIPVHHQGDIPQTVFFPSGDPSGLFHALQEAESTAFDASIIRDHVKQEYSLDRWTDEMMLVYRSLIK